MTYEDVTYRGPCDICGAEAIWTQQRDPRAPFTREARVQSCERCGDNVTAVEREQRETA